MPGPVHPAHRAQPNTPARDIDDGAETPRNKPANRNPQTPPFHRDGSPPTPDRAREKPPQRRPNSRLNPQKAHRRASSRLVEQAGWNGEIDYLSPYAHGFCRVAECTPQVEVAAPQRNLAARCS